MDEHDRVGTVRAAQALVGRELLLLLGRQPRARVGPDQEVVANLGGALVQVGGRRARGVDAVPERRIRVEVTQLDPPDRDAGGDETHDQCEARADPDDDPSGSAVAGDAFCHRSSRA